MVVLFETLNNRIKGSSDVGGMVNTTAKFSAYRNAALTSSASWAIIVFDTELFDTNSNFDTSTGRYTVPVTGYYVFSGSAGNTAATNTEMGVSIFVDGTRKKTGHYHKNDTAPNISTVSALIYCTAGQLVDLRFIGGGGSVMYTGEADCWFTGHLLSVDA